jgi:hypothetical protein
METYTDSDFRTLFGLLKYLHTDLQSLNNLQKTYFSQQQDLNSILALNPEVIFELDDGYARDFIELALTLTREQKTDNTDCKKRLLECWPDCLKTKPGLKQTLYARSKITH